MNGFLIANKPTGITSSNLVIFVRKRLPRGTAVGHGGTLDPEASGVLPLCIGSATRLFDYIIDKQKTYIAELQLGVETDTQDATGAVVRAQSVTSTEAELRAALRDFVGEIEQVPPMYSAVKRGGKRLYQLARRGRPSRWSPASAAWTTSPSWNGPEKIATVFAWTAGRASTSARSATTSAGNWAAARTWRAWNGCARACLTSRMR